jgi:DNA (cytosine-5)-methyltransferase 1
VELADAIDAARSVRGEQPCVVLWENVPGVLSDRGNAFGSFLAALAGADAPAIAFSAKDHGADAGDIAPTPFEMGHAGSHANGGGQVAVTARSGAEGDGTGRSVPITLNSMLVRRLTPRECERLQGFPDDYTAIPWRGKPASECPDGPRYKALGNSWAVPVVRWIGSRIDARLRGQE